nr:restriction endonuclease subunit S [Exiguobacterium indicum]
MANEIKPKLRFKEFDGSWKKLKINNFIKKMYGGASIAPSDYQTEGIPTIPKSSVNSNGIANLSNSKYVSESYFEKNVSSGVYQGDFVTSLRDLVPTAPSMGRIVKVFGDREKYLIPQGVYRLILQEDIDENFLIYISNSHKFRKNILKIKSGSTQVHIRNSQYLGIGINAPIYEEQKRIGSFLKKIDNIISLNQQELDVLKKTKQGFLQKMFPKNEATIPEIRFPEFRGDWRLTTLGEIAEIVRGASPRPIQNPKWFDDTSEVGWLRISDVTEQNGRIHRLEQRLSVDGQSKTRVLTKPHLMLSIAATVGKPVINYVSTGVHDGFLIFKNPQFDIEFMFQWLEMFRLKWSKYGQPGSQVNLNSELVRNQILYLPDIKEQIKIGKFFRQLDEVIDLKEEELEALKKTKQGFLQKMFV